jgi:hypothetical protein
MPGAPPFQGMPGAGPGFPGFMNGAGGWAGGGMGMGGPAGDPSGMHSPGVIRRGRQPNRAGPYDRRGPGARYPDRTGMPPGGNGSMFGAAGGRPLPGAAAYNIPAGHPAAAAAMAAGFGGPMRWDGATGAQAMPPKEAVQGRSLKSYEDLDAVGGSGGGELNY